MVGPLNDLRGLPPIGRHSLESKDVNEYSLMKRTEAVARTYGGSAIKAQLGMCTIIVLIGLCRLKEIGLLENLRSQFLKTIVVGPWHTNINVVIPWYKSVMTHRAKQRASVAPASQVMLRANINELAEHIQLYGPHLLHVGGDTIPFSRFRVKVYPFVHSI